jgi:hypothetical protein
MLDPPVFSEHYTTRTGCRPFHRLSTEGIRRTGKKQSEKKQMAKYLTIQDTQRHDLAAGELLVKQ